MRGLRTEQNRFCSEYFKINPALYKTEWRKPFCQNWFKIFQELCRPLQVPAHTVSFDWFLSGLEWIINLEFCSLKLMLFYQKLLWNVRSRLNFSTFEFLSLYLDIKVFIFCARSFNFDQTYLYTGLKTQNVEEFSLDLIFHYNFW